MKRKKCKRCGKKKLALVCAGVTKADLPVAGMKVSSVRNCINSWLTEMADTNRVKPMINGVPATEDQVVKAEDRLDFVVAHGFKESKPDPVQLGEELAVFLRDKTVLWQKDSLSWQDSPEVEAFLRIIWERDFWRGKCLGE